MHVRSPMKTVGSDNESTENMTRQFFLETILAQARAVQHTRTPSLNIKSTDLPLELRILIWPFTLEATTNVVEAVYILHISRFLYLNSANLEIC